MDGRRGRWSGGSGQGGGAAVVAVWGRVGSGNLELDVVGDALGENVKQGDTVEFRHGNTCYCRVLYSQQ